MSLEARSSSALFKRAEQLKRWEESETNKEPAVPKHTSRRIKFSSGCVFLAACAAGDKDEVLKMLDQGADIDTANVDGLTALHQVCHCSPPVDNEKSFTILTAPSKWPWCSTAGIKTCTLAGLNLEFTLFCLLRALDTFHLISKLSYIIITLILIIIYILAISNLLRFSYLHNWKVFL